MLKVKRNNPILYIFIGNISEDLINGIKKVQLERIGDAGIAYIIINDFSNIDDLIKLEIGLCQSKFITQRYSSLGEIKVNYIINADDENALMFTSIREGVDYHLQYLYQSGTTTEVFALIDDTPLSISKNCRDDVIEILLEMQSKGELVYILSNVNSHNFFSKDNLDNIIHSIALLAIIKDCISEKNSWYNEQYFIEDCHKCGGNFMTLGHINLEKYYDSFRNALISKLLLPIKNYEHIPFNIDFNDIGKVALPTVDMLMSLIASETLDENEKKQLTNGEILNKIFASRLNLFYELNFKAESILDTTAFSVKLKESLKDVANNPEFGFYAVLNLTNSNGKLLKFLFESQKAYENTIKEQNYNFDKFISSKGHSTIKTKQGFMKIDTYAYELALQYICFKLENTINLGLLKRVETAISIVKDFNEKLTEMKNSISGLYNERLERSYELSTNKYIEENPNGFLAVYEKMYPYLAEGKIEKYIALIKEYINTELLRYGLFKKPVSEQMTQDLLDWIEQNRHYNIFLKTGGINLHSGIYVLSDSKNPLLSTNDVSKFKGMNFFYGNYSGNVDILYQMGSFVKEDLYYNDYKNR